MFRALIILNALLLLTYSTVCQVDSLDAEIPQVEDKFQLKPMIGLGIGTFTFYGETGKGLRSNNPFNSSPALSLSAHVPINSYLDFTLSGVYSHLTVNEPGTGMHNNFRSEITGGSALVTYNFNNLLPRSAFWQPYIGTGISSFEFLSKADLYDANGNEYHLWSNGALMSIAQDAPNASEAVFVERDYVYETDLRGLNTEGNGAYQDRTLAVPLSLGVNFMFSKHLKGQLGTTMFFSFNDLVDNRSSAGSGDSQNDRFLHSSISMSYDLHIPSKKKKHFEIEFDEDGEDYLTDFDSDKDGIHDFEDECLGHPEGIEVDEKGCPLDKDEDGIADYLDDDPMTPEGALVDQYGVTIEDEAYLNTYMNWIDSLGEGGMDMVYSKVESEKNQNQFSVLILPDKDGFNQQEINSILAEENVRPSDIEGEDGFLVGNYETLPEAVNKKLELRDQGLVGTVQKENSEGEVIDIDDEINAMTEIVEERNKTLGAPEYSDDVVYRVQVGAFRYDLSENIFSSIDDLLVIKGNDGLTRYMSESYMSSEDAVNRRVDLLTDGFEGAFVTAYRKGKRISLAQAGFEVVLGGQDLVEDMENHSINPESVKFHIQLGEFTDEIPTETLEKFLEMGKVRPVPEKAVTRYVTGEFKTYAEAKAYLEELKAKGMNESQIMGSFNGKIITLEEALNILGANDQSLAE